MRRTRLAVTLLALPPAVMLAAGLFAQTGGEGATPERARVTLNDGRTIEGELVERTAEGVTLRISGIATRFAAENVERVEMVQSRREQLLEQRKAVADDDLAARFDLAQKMAEAGELELARDELQAINDVSPGDRRVRSLMTQVEQRMRLRRGGSDTAPPPRGETAPPPKTTGGDNGTGENAQGPGRMNRLSTDDINRIRVWEIDLSQQPRVRVPNETLDELFERYNDDPDVPKGMAEQAALRRAPGHEQLAAIFKARAKDLYDTVQVLEDPPAMQAWRTNVHATYVLSYCASSACHGGETDAMKALPLLRDRDLTGAYTNFYLLQGFRNQSGDMIERDQARLDQSLLLQYGLPQDVAQFRHPAVKGWRPFFARKDDARYRQYLDALAMLWNPAPDYGVKYDPWAEQEGDIPAENIDDATRPDAAPRPDAGPTRPAPPPVRVPELFVPLPAPAEDDPAPPPAPAAERPTGDDALMPVDAPPPVMP